VPQACASWQFRVVPQRFLRNLSCSNSYAERNETSYPSVEPKKSEYAACAAGIAFQADRQVDAFHRVLYAIKGVLPEEEVARFERAESYQRGFEHGHHAAKTGQGAPPLPPISL